MSFGELGRLVAARESLRTALRSVFALAEQIEARVKAGATLDEVQGQLDLVRSEFDKNYAQLESIRTQARALEPPPQNFLAELDTSLDVNRPRNYQTIGEIITKAGQNTNKRNAEIANTAAADQGPKTDSAGGEVTAEGAATQAPAAPAQQQAANGAVTTASTTTQPSNAEKFAAPGTTTVQPSVPALPGNVAAGNASTAGSGPVVGASINTGTGSAREAAPLPALAPLPYKAVTVVSSFERGRFTQELEGVLLIFTKPPERVIPGTEDLSYQSTPKVETEGAPPAATQPSKLPNTPVSQQPNASNLAQQPTSTPGEPAPAPESTDTVAPAETAPATSAAEPVAAPPANQPPPFKIPGGYVTQIPPGVTLDPNSGAWIYRDAAGEEVMFTASTNEALAARVRAYDTGQNVQYVDYDRNSGWVYETFDPNTQTRNIVGPAPNPYEQSAGTAAPSQNMAREN